MNNALERFYGTEIYGCKFLGTRLNMNSHTYSLCHEAQMGDQVLGSIEELSPEKYYESLRLLIEKNQKEGTPCRRCDKGEKYLYKFRFINYVTICTSEYCNSSCIYCTTHFGSKDSGYDPIPFLEKFHDEKLFSKKCYFDWGGGEPTLNPWFKKTIKWLNNCGYYQRINTNAILYSKETEIALIHGRTQVRISVDSGTKDCFSIIKGHNAYNDVWKHIYDYCKISDNIYIKYNICNYNSDYHEIEEFIQKCKKCGVRHIIIDAEVNSYQPRKNAGPFYFTIKEFNAAHYLEKLAREEGLDIQISSYAFSVRAEFDKKGNYILPEKYYDNLDYEICSHGITVKTFPNVMYMVEYLRMQDYPIVVWGGGQIGKICITILKEYGILIENVIDNDLLLQNSSIQDIVVCSPNDYFSNNFKSQVILTGRCWKEMLQEINQSQYDIGEVYYLADCYYLKFYNNNY